MPLQRLVQGIQRRVAGVPVTITRPNNTTAYVASGVYGDAADARVAFAVPALPADALMPGFNSAQFMAVQTRNPADPTLSLQLVLFTAQPATVMGDQAPFRLSDADIANILPGSVGTVAETVLFTSSNTAPQWNRGAGIAGRRGGTGNFSLMSGLYVPGGATLYAYLFAVAAYVPVALEQITFRPVFNYTALPTL